MAKEMFEIRWTCVPSDIVKGTSGDQLRLKIVIAPRVPLDAEALGIFNDWFSRWPEKVKEDLKSFGVTFATDRGLVATLPGEVCHDRLVKDASVWPKAFPPLATQPKHNEKPERLFVDQGFGSSYNAITAERQIQARRIIQVVASLLTPQNPEEYL
ncbi:MAG: hypothetical protein ACK6DS_06430, partial [Planctomycetota bacterium]